MVEVARLESVYRFIAYPGFESPSLRQDNKKSRLRAAFFISWRREADRLRALRRGFEGFAPTEPCRAESPICQREANSSECRRRCNSGKGPAI